MQYLFQKIRVLMILIVTSHKGQAYEAACQIFDNQKVCSV